ncbi:hypothetical protein [Ralstonia pickettii]|uniref:hypothetical protein n=1 Tax=Ralstonia pickettii TaxID=329 RepID=UPI0008188E2B|nr:hypothetical protein [Ralstonia pickettii]OCS47933.1 hypothetical protein BEK67_10200 [Ralstonia pickettii]
MNYNVWETCLLLPFGLNRAECASWVQAWGSILAIGGTAFAAYYQGRKQLQATIEGVRQTQKQAHLQVAETLWKLAENALKMQRHIASRLDTRDKGHKAAVDGLPFEMPELLSIERALEAIPLHELPATLVSPSMILTWTVRQFRTKVEMALQLHRRMDAADFEDFFARVAEMNASLDKTVADFGAKLETARSEF